MPGLLERNFVVQFVVRGAARGIDILDGADVALERLGGIDRPTAQARAMLREQDRVQIERGDDQTRRPNGKDRRRQGTGGHRVLGL